jgi:hypothetical protein
VRVAMLAPIAWRTPPCDYGPWEQVVATLTDALVERGVEVTLFATGDSATRAELVSVVAHGYEVDHSYDVKVHEALHIASCFELAAAGRFDLIHNHFDCTTLSSWPASPSCSRSSSRRRDGGNSASLEPQRSTNRDDGRDAYCRCGSNDCS